MLEIDANVVDDSDIFMERVIKVLKLGMDIIY